jgi:hypothetical protein
MRQPVEFYSMFDKIQRFPRAKMVLPLRVWLDDHGSETSPAHWAHTIDTCDIGCRIGGLRAKLSPGQIITLQRRQHKAPFRVIWSRELEAQEHQAGVEVLDHSINIWSVNATPNPPENRSDAPNPVSGAPVSSQAAPVIMSPEQISIVAAARRRLGWGLAAAFAALSIAIGLYLYGQAFSEPQRVAINSPVPAPPTAWELARLTPEPHLMPASLTRPLRPSATLVEVAEAPTGNVVYPVAPADFLTGKVRLQILVAANGLVKQIHLLSGEQSLAEAAAQAVRRWHYASLTGAGSSSERETSVTVSFLGTDAVSLQFPDGQYTSSPKDN